MATRRPSILLVITDDQGPWAVPWRMPELHAPNLARLAEQSTIYDSFHCASPVCSPARASLITGRMPSAHGIHDWLVGERHPQAREKDHFLRAPVTTPEVLAEAGYRCAMAGKWHIGSSRVPAAGFTDWYAHRVGGGPYIGAPVWDGGEKRVEPRYFTEAVTDEAIGFLQAVPADTPFYLHVAYTAPHDPWIDQHPENIVALYDSTNFPSIPRREPHPWVEPRRADFAAAFADPHPHLAGYCAAITAMDRGLGRLLAAVDESGRANDTIVVFMSDNGFSCGHHGVWGKGNGTEPLNFWTPSIEVPLLLHLPGQDQLYRIQAPRSAVDWHATILDLVGIDCPDDPLGAGVSFAADLRRSVGHDSIDVPGQPSDDPVLVFGEYGSGRCVRSEQHSLIVRPEGPNELYDLTTDPDEEANLIDDPSRSSEIDALFAVLWDWFGKREDAIASAWGRSVRGRGQVRPVDLGLTDASTYVQIPLTLDGTRDRSRQTGAAHPEQ